MTTSIDSNVLINLWDARAEISDVPKRVLDQVRLRDTMVVCACVYAELVAGPGRTSAQVDGMLADTRIRVDWKVGEDAWRLAGERFAAYAVRRRGSTGLQPRRLLADFVIGAHAEVHGYSLLTMDQDLYRRSFPKLHLLSI